MSHVVVIIQRSAAPAGDTLQNHAAADSPTYEYRMPVPHDASPADVGEMVKRAYKRLESADAG